MNKRGKILSACIITLSVFFAELLGGLAFGSLSLVADSFHVIMDVIALMTSYLALRLATKPNSSREYTYGYHYLEVLATLFNGATLSVTIFFIIDEAISRFLSPVALNAPNVIFIAIIGLVANMFSAKILGPEFGNHNHNHAHNIPENENHVHEHEHTQASFAGRTLEPVVDEGQNLAACTEELPVCPTKACVSEDMNIKIAYIHVLGDAFSSIVVIAGAIIIALTGITWVDPIFALVIAAILFRATYFVLKNSLTTLLGKSPVDIRQVQDFFNHNAEITGVHDLHVWQLCSRVAMLSAHIKTNIYDVKSAEELVEKLEGELIDQFNIQHVTIQVETPGSPAKACNICHD
ncbi:MAG TPA: cation diffusion facilitator family transporter [Candidatus Lokiarchaeia archaeon]|nr:cation diffusion facilitator family transporter [Candidatus Lokiarchaeia archaeon]